MHRPLHALLYCRSAHNSARALGAQEERCRRRAAQEGAETTATLFDHGPTAGLDRPGLAEVRGLLKSGSIDLVVVDSPTRLTHSIAGLRALREEVTQAGARLIFVSP